MPVGALENCFNTIVVAATGFDSSSYTIARPAQDLARPVIRRRENRWIRAAAGR